MERFQVLAAIDRALYNKRGAVAPPPVQAVFSADTGSAIVNPSQIQHGDKLVFSSVVQVYDPLTQSPEVRAQYRVRSSTLKKLMFQY